MTKQHIDRMIQSMAFYNGSVEQLAGIVAMWRQVAFCTPSEKLNTDVQQALKRMKSMTRNFETQLHNAQSFGNVNTAEFQKLFREIRDLGRYIVESIVPGGEVSYDARTRR